MKALGSSPLSLVVLQCFIMAASSIRSSHPRRGDESNPFEHHRTLRSSKKDSGNGKLKVDKMKDSVTMTRMISIGNGGMAKLTDIDSIIGMEMRTLIKNPAPSWASISDTTSSTSPTDVSTTGTTYIPSSIATTTFPPIATPTFTPTTTRPVSTAPESVGIVDYSECFSIADYIKTGQSFPSITSSKGGQLFLDTIVNRTETNFTFFGVSSDAIFLDKSILMKFRSPLWNGHVLNILEGLTIEGQALDEQGLRNFDGMTIPSMVGNPIIIQTDPSFRVNNVIIATRNVHVNNGIVHNLLHYPDPLAPWVNHSMMDVLLELNANRRGDISVFIGFINTIPDLLQQLMEVGRDAATTIFVPTNRAFNDLTMLIPEGYTLLDLVLNHVVSGNVATCCWKTIPMGTQISDTELTVVSRIGQTLNLVITKLDHVNTENNTHNIFNKHDDMIDNNNIDSIMTTTINGNVTIIQADIFADQGIIHIIDNSLLLR